MALVGYHSFHLTCAGFSASFPARTENLGSLLSMRSFPSRRSLPIEQGILQRQSTSLGISSCKRTLPADANEERKTKHLHASVICGSSVDAQAIVLPEVEAADVVLGYYAAVNKRDLEAAMEFFAPDCVLEDMIYTKPFRGKQVITEYLRKFFEEVPAELVFVIDKISRGSSTATGLTWHAELNGKSFPFSRGCSLYECALHDGKLCITYGRDIPEPASKPGGSALVVIRLVVWLALKFPFLGDTLAKF